MSGDPWGDTRVIGRKGEKVGVYLKEKQTNKQCTVFGPQAGEMVHADYNDN